MALLEVDGLEVAYGKIRAVKGISFSVDAGGVVTLIGANGAGKTTTLRTISGLLAPAAGAVTFDGRRIDGMPAHEIVELGIAHVPEGRRVFPDLTVAENLLVGGYTKSVAESRRAEQEVYALFPRLAERRRQHAGLLSGGEQQMLAIGRALMARPRLMLVDELSLGLMPAMVDLCFRALLELKRQGLAILLVEQNTHRALAAAERVVVLVSGRKAYEADGEQARRDPAMVDSFLGLKEVA